MAQKPSIPKGTRDFTPAALTRRDYIISVIKKHFANYGYEPIETPAMENLSTLMGKYGDEGDRLIFKVLNSGDFLSKVDDSTYNSRDSKQLMPKISEKALRYDLTVPFARYVVMHQNEIDFPFKRYQIQPVWRADRPQKGRFREFYQCDADVVGPRSLFQEVELILLYDAIMTDLGFSDIPLKLNHRQLLAGIADIIGAGDKLVDFTVALDKLDKVGRQGVEKEMRAKGISGDAIEKAAPLFELTGTAEEKMAALKGLLEGSELAGAGLKELSRILELLSDSKLKTIVPELEITLARGLNYYTGCILELGPPPGVSMGSLGGGGRYDDLTGIFGVRDLCGVGISLGLDRIHLVMDELDLFPESLDRTLDVMIVNFGGEPSEKAFQLLKSLRDFGIKADLYPSEAKIQKQMKYANNKNVAYVVLLGEEELSKGNFIAKNMSTGAQESFAFNELEDFVRSL